MSPVATIPNAGSGMSVGEESFIPNAGHLLVIFISSTFSNDIPFYVYTKYILQQVVL